MHPTNLLRMQELGSFSMTQCNGNPSAFLALWQSRLQQANQWNSRIEAFFMELEQQLAFVDLRQQETPRGVLDADSLVWLGSLGTLSAGTYWPLNRSYELSYGLKSDSSGDSPLRIMVRKTPQQPHAVVYQQTDADKPAEPCASPFPKDMSSVSPPLRLAAFLTVHAAAIEWWWLDDTPADCRCVIL